MTTPCGQDESKMGLEAGAWMADDGSLANRVRRHPLFKPNREVRRYLERTDSFRAVGRSPGRGSRSFAGTRDDKTRVERP